MESVDYFHGELHQRPKDAQNNNIIIDRHANKIETLFDKVNLIVDNNRFSAHVSTFAKCCSFVKRKRIADMAAYILAATFY